ncbi:MAG: hypothetical protein QM779_08195 [Propionicimonas sp.]|uniref:hypothetical protein n=1 Tax=Propionicimonas sp. TaxID=1955623 RepID=UPI003D0B3C36
MRRLLADAEELGATIPADVTAALAALDLVGRAGGRDPRQVLEAGILQVATVEDAEALLDDVIDATTRRTAMAEIHNTADSFVLDWLLRRLREGGLDEIIASMRPGLAGTFAAVGRYSELVPASLTAEALLEAEPDALLAYRDGRDAAAMLASLDRWTHDVLYVVAPFDPADLVGIPEFALVMAFFVPSEGDVDAAARGRMLPPSGLDPLGGWARIGELRLNSLTVARQIIAAAADSIRNSFVPFDAEVGEPIRQQVPAGQPFPTL